MGAVPAVRWWPVLGSSFGQLGVEGVEDDRGERGEHSNQPEERRGHRQAHGEDAGGDVVRERPVPEPDPHQRQDEPGDAQHGDGAVLFDGA